MKWNVLGDGGTTENDAQTILSMNSMVELSKGSLALQTEKNSVFRLAQTKIFFIKSDFFDVIYRPL